MTDFDHEREKMVARQIAARGVKDPRVLQAMREVRREEFVDAGRAHYAYDDGPLPIGKGQTISQPYIVAWMSELLELAPEHEVLEVGAGCGYQTAVLAKLCRHVYSLELVPELARQAKLNLMRAGIDNVTLAQGDGRLGWPHARTFERIIAAAAAVEVPQPLLNQLAPGGRMVLPVGRGGYQQMMLVTRNRQGALSYEELGAVAFVPLV